MRDIEINELLASLILMVDRVNIRENLIFDAPLYSQEGVKTGE